MRKFKYILAAFLLAASLTACTTPGFDSDENSLPTVDIVQRSQLMDAVTERHIFTDTDNQIMADMGLKAELAEFSLVADDVAQLELVFTAPNGKKHKMITEAAIDYNMPQADTFTDIRFYWGGVTKTQQGPLITLADSAVLIPTDGSQNIKFDLSFVKEKDGYIVHTTADFGRFAFFYYTPLEAGLAVFDSNGQLIAEKTEEIGGEASVNMLNTHSALLVSDVPFSYTDEFDGWFVNENLLLIDHSWRYEGSDMEEYRLYNCADNTVSYSVLKGADKLMLDDTTYSVYNIFVPDGDDRNIGYGILALKQQNGEYTGCVLSDTKGYSYEKQNYGTLCLTDGGNLRYHTDFAGVLFDFDFADNKCEKSYLITDDMLMEKVATSKDKNYSLYQYGGHSHNNYFMNYLALKNEKSGKNSFVSDYRGYSNGGFILESGFFSNGEIYLMYDFDFEIFDPANPQKGPIFSIGEKYPLGIKDDEGYPINTLWAVRRDPLDKTFIVVNDHLGPHRWYLTDEMFDGIYFKDTFDVSLLDKDGNITKTFTTGMKVPRDTNILNISISGDILTMTNSSRETGEVIQQGKLNIKNGKFTVIKQ